MKNQDYAPIQNYAIVGNCRTTALIHKEGSIDFFCYPRFDSPSIFAKLLDAKKGGFFNTRPSFEWERTTQSYLLESNVLLTRFFSESVTLDIIDFMPCNGKMNLPNQLVRIVRSVRGAAKVSFEIDLAPGYGDEAGAITKNSEYVLTRALGNKADKDFVVESNISLFSEGSELISSFELTEGGHAVFVLGEPADKPEHGTSDVSETVSKLLDTTLKYWRNWLKKCNYLGDYKDKVQRSALVLKLLTSMEFGSTVAAATFSLPETIGGKRNYDYRFTWIRDAAFTMYAFMRLGFLEESQKFMNWIEDRIDNDLSEKVELQIMYTIDGSKELEEKEIDLEGYRKSSPVRIGNAATEQIQLDIFGELMDTIYLFDKYGEPISYTFWGKLEKLLEFVCKNWESKDHGIWEVRETKRHYLYTRVMCWVALDRAVRLVRKRSFPTDLKKWIKNKNLIYKDIQKNFWNDDLQSFVHFKGATTVDCSMLIMPLVRVISPHDERWVKTMKVIEKQLVSDVLVYRNMHDEIPKQEAGEGAFLIGSFWYVECLSRAGQVERAAHYFEKLMGYGNHVHLFSEEMSLSGMHLGNFPQAFTHLGMISAAYNLKQQKKKWNYTNDGKGYRLF